MALSTLKGRLPTKSFNSGVKVDSSSCSNTDDNATFETKLDRKEEEEKDDQEESFALKEEEEEDKEREEEKVGSEEE